jgi:hypothetical protein
MKGLFIIAFVSLHSFVISQEEHNRSAKSSKPVRFTFGTGILIDNQTVATPYKGGLELQIHLVQPY